jgi:hypothetical protein
MDADVVKVLSDPIRSDLLSSLENGSFQVKRSIHRVEKGRIITKEAVGVK